MKPLLLLALVLLIACNSKESKQGGIRPDTPNVVKKDSSGVRELPDSAF